CANSTCGCPKIEFASGERCKIGFNVGLPQAFYRRRRPAGPVVFVDDQGPYAFEGIMASCYARGDTKLGLQCSREIHCWPTLHLSQRNGKARGRFRANRICGRTCELRTSARRFIEVSENCGQRPGGKTACNKLGLPEKRGSRRERVF